MTTGVLIVEDKIVIAHNLKDRLEALGYTVLGIATSGLQGIELADKTQPDLVLMDIKLPGRMDGIEAAEQIHQRWDIPVVYLTGHADSATVERAKVTGPFGYLLKPFDPKELHVTIEMALYKHAMETRLKESEKKYRNLVEQSLQGIIIVGNQAPWILFANSRLAEIGGYDPEELQTMESGELQAIVHPEDRAPTLRQLAPVLDGHALSASGEFRFVHGSGAACWAEYHASRVKHQGKPALQAAVIDITERKEAEEALLEAHRELEGRVKARTADLAKTNRRLKQEVSERQQAQAALQQHANELRTLSSLGHKVSATLLLDEVAQAALHGVSDSLTPDLAMLYLRQGDALHLHGLYPRNPEFERQVPELKRVGECLCGLAAAEGRPVYAQDITTDPRCTLQECKNVGMHSFAALPLRTGTEIQGVLGVASSEKRNFAERKTFLEALSSDIAIGLQNALLHESVQRHVTNLGQEVAVRQDAEQALRQRNRELALLNRVVSATTSGRELSRSLQTVFQEMGLALDLSHAVALLCDREGAQASVVAAHSRDSESSPLLGNALGWSDAPVFERLLEQGKPLSLTGSDLEAQLGPAYTQICRGPGTVVLLVPLPINGNPMGGVGLCVRESGSFCEDELRLINRVADQVSGALTRARLEEMQRRLSTAVEQTADVVLIVDENDKIIYVNPAFERLTGFSQAEALGETPGLFRSGWHDEEHYRTLRETINEGCVWQGRLVNKGKDGALFPVDATITPLRNPDGEVENHVATLRDVTREVQLEDQIRHAQKMDALGHLAGSIAHDFNNYLSVIRMASTMLKRRMQSDDPLLKYADYIQETTGRATGLTRQLLSFSRRDDIQFHATDLNQIVADLGWMLQRLAGNEIEFVECLQQDLLPVRANSSQMEQVIMNLVVNARDAMPKGGTLHVETANKVLDEEYVARHKDARVGSHVILRVRDTGMGMDDAVRDRIFEPFFTTKQPGLGTGLGMSTVFGIVQQAGGHILIDSKVGQGTTIEILLPSQDEKEPGAVVKPSGQPQHPGGKETVLVVEDDPVVRDLATQHLRSLGYQVQAADSGPQAAEIGQQMQADIHLALIGLILPSMDGLALARQLQAVRPDMRVVFMSGQGEDVDLVRTILKRDMALLPKPFDLHDLASKVRTVLNGRQDTASIDKVERPGTDL